MSKHTPGPWTVEFFNRTLNGDPWSNKYQPVEVVIGNRRLRVADTPEGDADARLIAAAPDLLKAVLLHQAWSDSERAGPDYGELTRDTHPDGEKIWRRWWDNQLDLCDRATEATRAAIAEATKEQ